MRISIQPLNPLSSGSAQRHKARPGSHVTSVELQANHMQTDKLALLPLVKRQVYCVGDRLRMDKKDGQAKALNNPSVVAPCLNS